MADTTRTLDALIRRLQGPVVVFGAGGFMGANLLRALLRTRNDCYAVTHQRFIPWRLVDLPTEQVLYADLTRPSTIEDLFRRFRFGTIFAFAAYGGYERQDDPDLIFRTNTVGLLTLLETAARHGFSALVHAGTSSEYGLNAAAPREDGVLIPNSHYAASKASAANLLTYYGMVRRLPVINLRYYSVYGPFEEPDRLIPRLLEHARSATYPPLVDPEISRDFVFIDDAVEAAVRAAVLGVHRAPGASLNIATGRKTTIRELVRQVRRLCAIPGEPTWGTMRNRRWDLREWYGNPARARRVLGWRARTPLHEGLARTRTWFAGHKGTGTIQVLTPRGTPARISAVIACYRDAPAIPLMHRRLTEVFTAMGVDYEIIFVNDASPDDSDAVLRDITATDRHVVGVEHSRNFGSQSAFLSGMEIATGDAVVLLDGDLQDPPELIPEFTRRWLEGNEVVYGRRVKREATLFMRAAYKLFYRLFRRLAFVPMPLDAGDFSLIDRTVVNQLLALPETDQFLRGLRAWVGFRQSGVDYVRPERLFGRSTNTWRKNIWWAKKGLFSFSFVPLEMMSYAGMLLTALSFLAMIAQVVAKILYPETPHGVTTIIVLVLFFGGVQLLAISILGEYLMKVFEETKKRPKFIRKEIRFAGRTYRSAEEIGDFLKGRTR